MNYRKIISLLGICAIIAYAIFSVIVVIEVVQDRLLQNKKCLKSSSKDFEIENNRNEIFVPRSMQMPQRHEIACFVVTKVENKYARSVIRRTWGKSVKPIFIMNLTDSHSIEAVENEAILFDDMIVINESITADYEHLFAMKYFVQNFNNAQYFLYVHDDVFVNTKNLFNFLNDENISSDVIIGNFASSPHQWKIINWMSNILNFPFDSYLNHPDLTAYIIPGFLVEEIFNKLQRVSSKKSNQCTLDLLLKRNFFANGKFLTSKFFIHHPCTLRNHVLVNRISPSEILDLWYYTSVDTKACNIF